MHAGVKLIRNRVSLENQAGEIPMLYFIFLNIWPPGATDDTDKQNSSALFVWLLAI